MKVKTYHLLFIVLLLGGCASIPDYPDEPQIVSVSISRNVVNQFDSLLVTIEFTDGDGDLGFEVENLDSSDCKLCACDDCDSSCVKHPTLSLFFLDDRTNCYVPYNLPYVPPRGNSEAISGKIQVIVYPLCFRQFFEPDPDNPYDTLVYEIKIKDNAQHLSNSMTTDTIYIRCDV